MAWAIWKVVQIKSTLPRLKSNLTFLAALNWRQLGNTERQPLDAMAAKLDLCAGIIANAFNANHRAFAKFVVKYLHACFDAMRRWGRLLRHGA
jgi:hypothetical protein